MMACALCKLELLKDKFGEDIEGLRGQIELLFKEHHRDMLLIIREAFICSLSRLPNKHLLIRLYAANYFFISRTKERKTQSILSMRRGRRNLPP